MTASAKHHARLAFGRIAVVGESLEEVHKLDRHEDEREAFGCFLGPKELLLGGSVFWFSRTSEVHTASANLGALRDPANARPSTNATATPTPGAFATSCNGLAGKPLIDWPNQAIFPSNGMPLEECRTTMLRRTALHQFLERDPPVAFLFTQANLGNFRCVVS